MTGEKYSRIADRSPARMVLGCLVASRKPRREFYSSNIFFKQPANCVARMAYPQGTTSVDLHCDETGTENAPGLTSELSVMSWRGTPMMASSDGLAPNEV